MDFWPLYWAIFLGIVSAMVTIEISMLALNYFLTRSRRLKMKEMQGRMESGDLTEDDLEILGASMSGLPPSVFSQFPGAFGPAVNQPSPPTSGTQGGSGQYL